MCALLGRRLGIDPEPVELKGLRMPREGRSPDQAEIDEMHRILLKVASHEMPSAAEIAFLREIKIEVMNRFTGPSMRAPDEDQPA